MRTRTRQLSYQANSSTAMLYTLPYPSGSTYNNANLGYNGPVIVTEESEETIVDDPSWGNRFKPVNHKVWRHTAQTGDNEVFGKANTGTVARWSGSGAYWFNWGHMPPRDAFADVSPVFPRTVAHLVNQAKDAFYNTNETDSLLNIAEASQLPGAIKSIAKAIESPSMLASLRRWKEWNRNRGKTLRSIAQSTSAAHLSWSFGLAPLISDMVKVSREIRDLSRNLKKGIANQGKTVTTRATQRGYLSNTGNQGRFGSTYLDRYVQQLTVPVQIATVRGINTEKFNLATFKALDYYARKFGSIGPASFAWEKVPFSFVFDWFVDVSDVTNKLDNFLTGGTKQIHDICVSTKYSVQSSFTHNNVHMPNTYYCITYDNAPMAGSELSVYDRQIQTDGLSVVSSGRFGKKQASLTASLLLQMVANRIGR